MRVAYNAPDGAEHQSPRHLAWMTAGTNNIPFAGLDSAAKGNRSGDIMRIVIFVAAALLGACTVGVEQERPVDAFAQPQEAQVAEQKELSRAPGSAQVAVAEPASAEAVEKMQAARREARAAVKRRALQTDLPELLAKIKATPEGLERRRLMGDYITAAHHADAEIAVKAMRELDELVATH